jgi:hypothetical protein
MKYGWLVLVGLLTTQTSVAMDAQCIDLTTMDEADLLHYRFTPGSEALALDALDTSQRYLIGKVRIVVQPIFDTDRRSEDRRFFRLANRWHTSTRPAVIRHAILFESGSDVRVTTLKESERLLRAKPYLYDARVLPRRLCGNRLDVDVVVRDVWTLTPDIDFSRLGGNNEYGYGLLDTNLLGRGREASLYFFKDTDRHGVSLGYADPNVAGSRVALATSLEENSDGSRQVLDVGQPFYSLDARRAYGFRGERDNAKQGLYQFGDKTSEFRRRVRQFSVFGGFSPGEHDAVTWRWLVGFNYDEHEFGHVSDAVQPDPFPADRTLAYPWIGFERVEDRFDTAANFDRIDRTEDIQLGRQIAALVGWSDHAFGADDVSRLVGSAHMGNALLHGDSQLFTYDVSIKSYWNFDTNAVENLWATAQFDYRLRQSARFTLATGLKVRYADNLTADEQLLGGGDTGLRGYPSRYQSGDKSYDWTLEERYLSDWYIARIVRVGLVGFVDVGRTWFSDDSNDAGYGTLADVGFGLRFESTRTRRDRVLHVDFAVPLVDGPEVSSFQISVQVQQTL